MMHIIILITCILLLSAIHITTAFNQTGNNLKTTQFKSTTRDGVYKLESLAYFEPKTVEDVQKIVRGASNVRVLGTGYASSPLTQSNDTLISLKRMRGMLSCCSKDKAEFEGGALLSDVAQAIDGRGRAIRTYLASDDISFIGAALTGSHGSGVGTSGHPLASVIDEMTTVVADGSIKVWKRNADGSLPPDFDIAVMSMGLLGVVVSFKINLSQTYTIRQCVYSNVPLNKLLSTAPGNTRSQAHENMDTLFSLGESVTAYTLMATANYGDDIHAAAGHKVALPLSTRSANHKMGRDHTTKEDYNNYHAVPEPSQEQEAKIPPKDRNLMKNANHLVLSSVWVKRVADGYGCRLNELESWSDSLTTSDNDLSSRVAVIPGRDPDEFSPPHNGAWFQRLSSFREGVLDNFSSGSVTDNVMLRSAYSIPREHAVDVINALARSQLRSDLTKQIHIIELRSLPGDAYPLSPCYDPSVQTVPHISRKPLAQEAKPQKPLKCLSIHITWKQTLDGPGAASVKDLVMRLEKLFQPFDALPHWGGYFMYTPQQLQNVYVKRNHGHILSRLANLAQSIDPQGKFASSFLSKYIMGFANAANPSQMRVEL